MKTIEVKAQQNLKFTRTLGIALTAVRYRLFRAIVTVAVIAVAMAFLMNILSESLIKRNISSAARDRIEALHQADQWVARLSVPQSPEEIVAALASAQPGTPLFSELVGFAQIQEEKLSDMQPLAQAGDSYLDFFEDLNYGRRRVLVGSASGTRIFDRLQDDSSREAFLQNLDNMRTVHFETDPEAFVAFLGEWPKLQALAGQIREGQSRGIDSIQVALSDRPILVALEEAKDDFGTAIRTAGFALSEQDAEKLAAQATLVNDAQSIDDTINNAAIRQAVAARMDVLPGDVTIDNIWDMVRSPDAAAWYIKIMEESNLPPGRIDEVRLRELARQRAESRLLTRAERATVEAGGGFMGIGKRMSWLAFVSMLVCVVGISNAMLMSVTERFREIATLKCLGAIDVFIMTVFLIESAILGLVGGIVGTLIGLAIGVARMAVSFRSLMFESFPLADLLVAACISIFVGILLAAVAAVYPSLRAARLAPMEAMRIE